MIKVRYITAILFVAIFVWACGGGGGGGSTPAPEPQLNHLRGVATLALLNPRFPVDDAYNIISASANPTYSFVYGTFGRNPNNFLLMHNRFAASGMNPTVMIYVLCGPCRKPRRDGSLEIFRPQLTINQLNKQIVSDDAVVEEYRKLVELIKSKFVINYPETTFIVVPELEDNLTDEAFSILLDTTREVFSDSPNVVFKRNALDNRGFPGVTREVHSNDKNVVQGLSKGDSISLDGQPFSLSQENGQPTFQDIQQLILNAEAKGVHVYLWRKEMQGLKDLTPSASINPDLRTYFFPFIEDWIFLMSLQKS